MRTRLEVGDIIKVYNPLYRYGPKYYPVIKVDGDKAITTSFRIFNAKIYNGRFVHIYDKQVNPMYSYTYTVVEAE